MADLGEGPGGPGTPYFGEKRRNDLRKKSWFGKKNRAGPPPYLKVWILHWEIQTKLVFKFFFL